MVQWGCGKIMQALWERKLDLVGQAFSAIKRDIIQLSHYKLTKARYYQHIVYWQKSYLHSAYVNIL